MVVQGERTLLERLLTVLLLFLALLQQPAVVEALTCLPAADLAEMGLMGVLEAARRLMGLLAQVLVLEERGLQVKGLRVVLPLVRQTFRAAAGVGQQQLDQTQQEQLVVLAGLVLTLIQHGHLQHQAVLEDVTQAAVEEVLLTEGPAVLVAMEAAAEALLGPLELPERLTREAVVVLDAIQQPQHFSTAALAVLEL